MKKILLLTTCSLALSFFHLSAVTRFKENSPVSILNDCKNFGVPTPGYEPNQQKTYLPALQAALQYCQKNRGQQLSFADTDKGISSATTTDTLASRIGAAMKKLQTLAYYKKPVSHKEQRSARRS